MKRETLGKYFLITSLFIIAAISNGCGSSSNNNNAPASTYTMSNGYCYANGQVVASSACVSAGVVGPTGPGVGGGYYPQSYYPQGGYYGPAPYYPYPYPYYPYYGGSRYGLYINL